jgi:UDP-glucose:glycoprotein glucosyltransferase
MEGATVILTSTLTRVFLHLPAKLTNSLLKAIRAEKRLATSLVSLGLTPKQAFQLLSDPVIGQKQTGEEAGEGVVDASDRPEGGGVVGWWNDIEKDSRYKQWPSSMTGVNLSLR